MSGNENRNHHPNFPSPTLLDQLDGAELLSKPASEDFLNSDFGRQVAIRCRRHARPPPLPDNPPCDGCKEPYAGTHLCSECGQAFYCCWDCRVSHWRSGHKAECAHLKRRGESTASALLESFTNNRAIWHILDVAGTYNAAVRLGLHDKIREVLDSDCNLLEQYRAGGQVRYFTSWVMLVLFRGNRAEGTVTKAFSCIDADRIKAFVKSHPDALFKWLHASVQHLVACFDDDVARNSTLRSNLTDDTNNVWLAWHFVLNNPDAARAILLPPAPAPPSAGADASATFPGTQERKKATRKRQARVDHATKIVKILRGALNLPWTREPDNGLQDSFLFVAAQVHVRLLSYQVPVNAENLFSMTGEMRQRYRNYILPMAKAEVEKGGRLTESETCAVVERMIQSFQL